MRAAWPSLILVVALSAMPAAAHHASGQDLPDFDLVVEQRQDFLSANEVFVVVNDQPRGFTGPIHFWLPTGSTLVQAAIMDAGQRQVLHSIAGVTKAERVEGTQTLMRADLEALNFTLEPGGEVRIHLAYRTVATEFGKRMHDGFDHVRVRVVPLAGWDAAAPGLDLTLVDSPGATFVYEDGAAGGLSLAEGEDFVVQFVPRPAPVGAGWSSLVGVLIVGLLVGALLGRWLAA